MARYDDPAVGILRNGMTLQKKQVGPPAKNGGFTSVEGGSVGFWFRFLSVVVGHGWKYAEVAFDVFFASLCVLVCRGGGRICEGCKNGSWLLWDLKIS